jgi:hypothetical protein
MVIGDSLGSDLGWGLARELTVDPHVHLVEEGKSDTGLSTSWYYDWPQHLTGLLSQYHPQLLVVLIGGNDEQSVEYRGVAEAFGTPGWSRGYAHQVHLILREAVRAGTSVMWVGMPYVALDGYRQGMQTLNQVVADECATVRGATFVSTWDYFSGPGGVYDPVAPVNGTHQVLRSPDGIHFSEVGEDVLATFVIKEIRAIYHVKLRAGLPMAITG